MNRAVLQAFARQNSRVSRMRSANRRASSSRGRTSGS